MLDCLVNARVDRSLDFFPSRRLRRPNRDPGMTREKGPATDWRAAWQASKLRVELQLFVLSVFRARCEEANAY
jgi:hypothetical protein